MATCTTSQLENGTTVMHIPTADTAAVTVLALFGVGSRYESLSLSGGSHFIEHMMFKGTGRRPTTRDISRDLDSVGADYNAFTAKDYTGYYIKLQAERLPLAVDMLDDMIFHSLYRQKDLDSERKVILEEIRMYEDNPMMLVDELMEEELYKGSTLGRRISGTVETMNGIGREALVAYRDRHYVPGKTVVVIAGRFDPRDARRLLEPTFGASRPAKTPKPFETFSAAKAGYRKPRVRIMRKDTEQVQVALGFPSCGLTDPRMPAVSVLSTILGGTMSSRLFLSVREKRGLAYSIRSGVNPYQDVGCVAIQAGLAKSRVHEALKVIMAELGRIASSPVTSEELTRAKDYVKGKLVLHLEESSSLADWYGRQQVLKGFADTPEERIAKIAAVTKEDVLRAAADVFRASRVSMGVIGQFDDERAFARHAAALN